MGTLRRLRARTDERGATLIMFAMMLPIFIAMVAFAADYGWIWWNGVRIQHGADAGALGGVVYEPGDQATAYAEAKAAASENGYNDLDPDTTVTAVDFADDPTAVDNSNQLRVTVTHAVPTFFMRVFGLNSVSITKTAVGEYVLPLAMGSDWPYFGQDPVAGNNPNYWGNIHGYYTGRQMGDRYASQCINGESKSGCALNPDRRSTTKTGSKYTGGYVYGIEVPDGASVAVEIFDGPFYRGGNDYFLVGDNPQGGSPGPTTVFQLYAPDPTPLDTTDNELLCTVEYAPQDHYADFDGDGDLGSRNKSAGKWNADPDDDQNGDGFFDWTDVKLGLGNTAWQNLWDRMCGTSFSRGGGIYPLRVVIKDPGGSDDRGLNRYSLRASTSIGSPRFFALGDMAIYANFAGNSSTFNLAEVRPVHAGKELVIELWDPDSGNNRTSIYLPDGSQPPCTWTSTDGRSGSLSACNITYSTSFNNHHLQIRVQIPNTYSCTSNCWWKINVGYPGGANDTTTWSARIEGNPVRLVE